MKYNVLLLLTMMIYSEGCMLFECESYVPQKWFLGQMEAELKTFKPTLAIGDTIHFSFRLPRKLIDTLNQELDVDKGVQVIVKITTTLNLSDTVISENDFFKTDTTIFHVFNQYFETKNIVGSSINPYYFACELKNGWWEIETEYITKKAGNFWAHIGFDKIESSATDLKDGVCMVGNVSAFGANLVWKQSEFNRIDVLLNDEKEKYPDYFGFMVE